MATGEGASLHDESELNWQWPPSYGSGVINDELHVNLGRPPLYDYGLLGTPDDWHSYGFDDGNTGSPSSLYLPWTDSKLETLISSRHPQSQPVSDYGQQLLLDDSVSRFVPSSSGALDTTTRYETSPLAIFTESSSSAPTPRFFENTVSRTTIPVPDVSSANLNIAWPAASKLAPKFRIQEIKSQAIRTTKTSKKTRRSGPLDVRAKEKADEMRDVGACWRCKKYKKSCNKNEICDSCKVPGFRIWPSELGCRRERLESLVLFLIPRHMENRLQSLPHGWVRSRPWRDLKPVPPEERPQIPSDCIKNPWTMSKTALRSIVVFGDDCNELCDIAEKYQKAKPSPVKALEMSRSLLIASCQLYPCFIATPGNTTQAGFEEMTRCTSAVRNSLRQTLLLIQKLCLSTKRTDWFPAFLSACMATCAAILFIDTAMAIPSPVRELIWGNFHQTRSGMRDGGYDLLVDLLRASTNGFNPIRQQQCWTSGTSGNQESQKSEQRLGLLGDDPAAREGLMEVKAWYEKHESSFEDGRNMFSARAYAAARVKAVGSLCKIFDF